MNTLSGDNADNSQRRMSRLGDDLSSFNVSEKVPILGGSKRRSVVLSIFIIIPVYENSDGLQFTIESRIVDCNTSHFRLLANVEHFNLIVCSPLSGWHFIEFVFDSVTVVTLIRSRFLDSRICRLIKIGTITFCLWSLTIFFFYQIYENPLSFFWEVGGKKRKSCLYPRVHDTSSKS